MNRTKPRDDLQFGTKGIPKGTLGSWVGDPPVYARSFYGSQYNRRSRNLVPPTGGEKACLWSLVNFGFARSQEIAGQADDGLEPHAFSTHSTELTPRGRYAVFPRG